MCGITAIFGKYQNKESFMKDSLNKIKHRGTSFYELRVFEKGALGANRLPIVGRDSGHQPLSNEEGTVFAAQNGEIFNYKELKEQLKSKGHKFKTDCDTEVLAHLYEEYGEKMIDKIDSEMYAFVIYDTKKNNYFVARDRFGVKPLFYAQDKNNFYFGSELKQLAQFDFIKEIKIFPKGCYMYNGKIKKYHNIKYSNKIKNLDFAKTKLTELMVEAVKKRVDTDLPIAVLLSGGVDSSLVMELATRFHKDVTAFILGIPGSSDYEASMRLCKNNNYKYRIVYPNVDYAKEFEKLIYHLEMYEAQVIRQSFALDILSKEVVRAGYRIALVGEASDELFGGYNEFSRLNDDHINKGCFMITNDLERSHNMRVDRMSMKHTLETRAPFFDTKVAEFALQIDGRLKVRRENHQITTKYILRKVAEEFLPDYIAWRYKVPFANGAGMNVGFNFRSQDGDVAKAVLSENKGNLDMHTKNKHGFITEEEQIYYQKYKDFKFNKLHNSHHRIITKETLSTIDDRPGEFRMLVAEFGRMPLYFPAYLAAKLGYYKKHKLDIDFISSGGDDLTYNSLMSGSAQIGIADPIFSFATNFKTKGKIVGQLIGRVPIVAVALDPNIKIEKLEDLKKYRIGTYQEFSTTNTLIKKLLPEKDLVAIKSNDLPKALKERKVDIGAMTLDYAFDLVGRGGHIVYLFEEHFKNYLFTGITICDNLDPKFYPAISSFLSAIKETINFIKKNKTQAIKLFEKEFSTVLNHEQMFDALIKYWDKKLKINSTGIENARQAWLKVYPWLMKASLPQFIKPTIADEIMGILNQRNISRDVPYKEDEITQAMNNFISQKKPIELIGFWGASDKQKINANDLSAIKKLEQINMLVKKSYKPGIKYNFLLADEHARLNKFNKKHYSQYLKQAVKLIRKAGFKSFYLSEIWKKGKLTDGIIKNKVKLLTKREWCDLRNSGEMEKAARRRGLKDYKNEAKRYYVMRKTESEILKRKFKNLIFWTYSEDIHQELYGDMPTLYLWANDRGHAEAPWFKK
jgi:asparagine synthase (glutamine-hydrolysing)